MSLSLLMIVCNESARLTNSQTIESVQGIIDEIVIVVQKSEDNTLELAKSYTNKVIEHQCYGYCEPSRKDGIKNCTSDWILMLDADEELTEFGQSNILSWCKPEIDAYLLRRITTIGGGIFEDTCHSRLFKKDKIETFDTIHRPCKPIDGAIIETIDSDIVINQAKTWDEQVKDNIRYDRLKYSGISNFCMPTFRDGTWDETIWNSVNINNEYRLPDDMNGWRVIDIGGHIGGFANACLSRGAEFVVSVEPNPASFDLMQKNLALYGNKSLCLRYAAWRSDNIYERLTNLGGQQVNTGANSCVPNEFGESYSISFDRVFDIVGDVDLVKFDCEGAEGPIIHTSKQLYKAKRIIGEWHSHIDDMFQAYSPVDNVIYSPELLREKLEGWGFKVEWCPTTNSTLGLFFAEKI